MYVRIDLIFARWCYAILPNTQLASIRSLSCLSLPQAACTGATQEMKRTLRPLGGQLKRESCFE